MALCGPARGGGLTPLTDRIGCFVFSAAKSAEPSHSKAIHVSTRGQQRRRSDPSNCLGFGFLSVLFSPRAFERRTFPKKGVCYTSSYLHIFSSESLIHLHIFPSSHLHIFSSSHLHIFTSSRPHIFTSSHLTFTSSHLHIFTPSHLHIFTSHLHIFTSSHLLILASSHLHTFTSSYLHIFSSSHLHIFSSSHFHFLHFPHIFTSSHLNIFSLSLSLAFLPSCPLALSLSLSCLLAFLPSLSLSLSLSLAFLPSCPLASLAVLIFLFLALLPSCPLLSFFFYQRGAGPTRRHEMQPFRTKWGSISKKKENCDFDRLRKCLWVKEHVCKNVCV